MAFISQVTMGKLSLISYLTISYVDECGFLNISKLKSTIQHPNIYRIDSIKPNKLKKFHRY